MLVIKRILLSIFIALASVSLFVAQTTRRQTTTANDFKVRYRTTMGSSGGKGMTGETVTMIKGARSVARTTLDMDSILFRSLSVI